MEDVASKIQVRSGLLVSRELGGFKFVSSTRVKTKASVELSIRKGSSSLARVADKGLARNGGKSDVDALDHWSRLPGSYGTGKRR